METVLAVVLGIALGFGGGRVTAPSPEVVVVRDGQVVESVKTSTDLIMVNVEGQNLEIREPKADPKRGLVTTYPLYKDSWGNWTAHCQTDCGPGNTLILEESK